MDSTNGLVHDGNTTGYSRKPGKSILKQRENQTMPILTPLNDTTTEGPSKLPNRRVSFADKVKLHQIDFVQVTHEDSESSNPEEVDTSDDSDDTSFLKLEADADKIVSALRIANRAHIPLPPDLSSDDELEEDEEQTMELTGQIWQKEDMEEDMELTGPIPTTEPQNGFSGAIEVTIVETLEANGVEEQNNLNELDEPEEVTMDITRMQSEIREVAEGLTEMEIHHVTETTEVPEITKADATEATAVAESQPEHLELQEETMDFTKIHPQQGGDQEITMEMTTFFEKKPEVSTSPESKLSPIEIPEAMGELSFESDEDEPMELTQPLTLPRHEKTEVTGGEDMYFPVSLQPEQEIQPQSVITEQTVVETTTETTEEPKRSQLEEFRDRHLSGAFDLLIAAELKSPILELSQPMELTQENETPEHKGPSNENHESNGHSDKKRMLDPSANLRSPRKSPRFETQMVTSTTTIPLADVSVLSWDGDEKGMDDAPVPVSLTEFLSDIGVKFYDDLEIATDMASRYSLSIPDAKEDYSNEEYYKANIQLPLLEVYELSCKELAGKIQQGKNLFQELKEKTFLDNPDLFRQYYRSSYYDQVAMKSRFHILKEYTRQQAKQIWYDWRTKLMKNILDVLLSNLEILQTDKTSLAGNISVLDSSYRTIQAKFYSLRMDVIQFREIQNQFQDLDADQIKAIKLKLSELNSQLLQHKEKISEKEAALSRILKEIESRNLEIASINNGIIEAENKINNTKHFNTSEIEGLNLISQVLQALIGMKFLGKNETLEFLFAQCIRVDMDFKATTPGIKYALADSPGKVLHHDYLLQNYALKLVDHECSGSIMDNFMAFRTKWRALKKIDLDIYRISLKCPIEFIDDPENISFNVKYFSFDTGLKVDYLVHIPIGSLSQVQVSAKVLREVEQTNQVTLRDNFATVFRSSHLKEITIIELAPQ